MKKLVLSISLIVFIAVATCAQEKITVAVAANMQYTMEALKAGFNKSDKTEIDVVLGASGKLTQQIMQSAPFDIFISADTAFPEKLAETGFAAARPKCMPKAYLYCGAQKITFSQKQI